MSRDGSGNYTRVPGSAYTNGTTADGAELDAEINDIATALTQSLSKDGQTVPTDNLPMGGFKHTNVNTASARTEYARASQVQDGTLTHLTSVSGADTITASAPIGLSAYATGQKFSFVSAGANTGAVTLNINSIGAKPVTKDGATALAAGDIASGAVCVVVYDGTQFQLVSARVVSAASDTIAGVVELATAAEVQAGTDTVRAVTPAGLAAYAGALSFRNKLINAAFTVNQRGYASGAATTAANQYTLDRWRVVTSGQALSWSGTAPNITITAPAGGVEQVVEGIWIEGGTYTLSWTGTATATVNGSAVVNGGQVTLTAGANATVRFSGGTVSKPQLERGPYATQFEHRPYGLELALCQRYFLLSPGSLYDGGGMGNSNGQGFPVFSHFPVVMRAAPTVSVPTITAVGCAVSPTATTHGVLFAVTYTQATLGVFAWNYVGGNVTFSAEL